jgi:hypothetical protein
MNVSSIISGKTQYTDPLFPPTSEALYFANKTYALGILNSTNT